MRNNSVLFTPWKPGVGAMPTFVVAGGTGGCHYDNHRCRKGRQPVGITTSRGFQWSHFWHSISKSYCDVLMSICLCLCTNIMNMAMNGDTSTKIEYSAKNDKNQKLCYGHWDVLKQKWEFDYEVRCDKMNFESLFASKSFLDTKEPVYWNRWMLTKID